MAKKIISIVLVFYFTVLSCIVTMAQDDTFTIYYDSLWNHSPKETAFFYTNFVKQHSFYQCTSYWVRSDKVYCKSSFADTAYQAGIGNFKSAIGKMIRYYKNGMVSDSIQVDNEGKMWQQYGYGETGKLKFHLVFDKSANSWKGERYDTLTTVQIEAGFPGGQQAWQAYLQGHLKINVPFRKGAPAGNYTVVVTFAVDVDGKIKDAKAENDPGYGTAEEAVRVIEKGPLWIPAWQNGKNVIYKQRQSITFSISR